MNWSIRRGASRKRYFEKVVYFNYATLFLTIILMRVDLTYLRQLPYKYKSHIDEQSIILKGIQLCIQWHILLSMNISHFCTIIEPTKQKYIFKRHFGKWVIILTS
jgi:hypothetical protein